jgi:hypothetical protein
MAENTRAYLSQNCTSLWEIKRELIRDWAEKKKSNSIPTCFGLNEASIKINRDKHDFNDVGK